VPKHLLPLIALVILLFGIPLLWTILYFQLWGRWRRVYGSVLRTAAEPIGFRISRWETEYRPVRDANFAVTRTLTFQPAAVDFGRYWGTDVIRLTRVHRYGPQLLFAHWLRDMARLRLPWEVPATIAAMLTGQLAGAPAGNLHLRPPHSVFGSGVGRSTFAYQLKPSGASTEDLNRLLDGSLRGWYEGLTQPISVFYRDGFLTLVLEVPFRRSYPTSLEGDALALIEAFDRCADLLGAQPAPA
jgi:hypothetical protein